jgi:hypothetical protein
MTIRPFVMWDDVKVVDARQSAIAPGRGLRSCDGQLIERLAGYFSVTRLV